jgi:hypothetical protein
MINDSKKIRCAIHRDMRSKRLNIIVHIFGFLILSLGILYLCQFLSIKINEGFISTKCPSTVLSDGRTMYLCDTEINAISILTDGANPIADTDGVCISTTTFGNNYFTCYDRPPGLVFDSDFGVYRKSNPILDEDTTPDIIAPNIDAACASFNLTTFQTIMGIKSTILIKNVVSNIILSTTVYKNMLNNISTKKCRFDDSTKLSLDICDEFSTTIAFFGNLPNTNYKVNGREAVDSLNGMLGVINTTINNLSNLSTYLIYSSFNGMKCDSISTYTVTTD